MGRAIQKRGELSDFQKWAEELGFICEVGRKHLVFRRPNTMPVFVAKSASDYRAWMNNRRNIRHAIIESRQRKELQLSSGK